MAEPTIIGSGQPHTVSLPEGSTVATRRRLRKAGAQLPTQPDAAQRTGQLPDELPGRGNARMRSGPGGGVSQGTPAGAHARMPQAIPERALDVALVARIAALTKRNQAVRATLDRLPGEDPASS